MIPELGHFALILTFVLALAQGIVSLYGAWRGNLAWMAFARPAARWQFGLVAFSLLCLAWSFVSFDFSVAYVAQNSSTKLPLFYRIAAVWGGHEGSLLLWMFMQTGWAFAVSIYSRSLPEAMLARVLGVLGLITAGFLLFVLISSNPFERMFPVPAEGLDLNTLLQDIGLIVHPPLLYMGYVGFSVAFAFAIAALLAGRLDASWARWSRPWTTSAWLFLTLGIAVGSWWAYYELGWGGWWFWDPVENSSFVPWLAGTALIHSLAVTEKRGSFKNWTVLLAISTFSLSILGAFLVRSGVLTSVHAFATDPARGVFILSLFAVIVGSSLILFAWRAPRVGAGGQFAVVSRESLLLVNNVLLVVVTGTVLLGTLYPLIMDTLGLGKISVGPPYFNKVFVPLMIPALVLIVFGVMANWKRASMMDMVRQLALVIVFSVVLGAAIPLLYGQWQGTAALGAGLAMWIVLGSLFDVVKRVRATRSGVFSQPRSWLGQHLAHIGVAVFVLGVTMVSHYETETDVLLQPGQTAQVGAYDARFQGVRIVPGPNYSAERGMVELLQDGKVVSTLYPEKRTYLSSALPMTESAINANGLRHIYVALGDNFDQGGWSVRLYYKPLVDFIWLGCLLMALGGALAISDRRYRAKQTRAAVQSKAMNTQVQA
ncbi:heme lyase CcmF/NrfE family subunit [Alcaligenes faecalis]|uniref:heme lyase CcmF/NrfE family subunit n=1 Tax=Alcaligenes faecalis TaxID=511 RepID=UPI0012930A76|nr:heme lyase CcmF/NrfE family subunit [Alcaligenes faecalis]QFY76762.1 heme lyase CcmF/NrfE family subunit [Alcaligenes faecalis]